MKLKLLVLFCYFCSFSVVAQQYSTFFSNNACRIDFHLSGNSKTTSAYVASIIKEPYWGGRRNHLSEFLNLGEYRFQVIDSVTQKLIYTDGFSSLYNEWQMSDEAKRISKSYEQSIQFPFPKNAVEIRIEKRLDYDAWEKLTGFYFSPTDKLIRPAKMTNTAVREIQKVAPSDKALDLAIIAEGYTEAEKDKFYADAKKLAESLVSHEPFATFKNKINVYAIAAVSAESGISMPHLDQWKNTAIGSHFYTFYEPRYLTSPNNFKIRDYAGIVPYDAIYVLANTTTYGGGGIYNFYSFASASSERAQAEVVVHEFGHSFAGLGDEYFYETQGALDAMYDITKEPWEPNLTTLVHFDKKWKNLLPKNAEIPTPITDKSKRIEVGVFEGGGYLTYGMYRPVFDCRMRSNEAKAFCKVCTRAIERVILYITE